MSLLLLFVGADTGAAPVVTTTLWDTSDPFFYDWWRKRAQVERVKIAVIEPEAKTAPALRVETIEAIEAADSLADIRALDLLNYEAATIRAAIREYQAMLDEDEEALLLALMH